MKDLMSGHIIAFLTVLIWGVTFVSTKILLEEFSPLEILFMRFAIGYAALWLIYPHLLRVRDIKDESIFALAGFSGVTLYFLLENMALTYTFASNVGVIVSAAPFLTAILAWCFLKGEKPAINFFLGFILALAGICLVSLNGINFDLNPLGDALAFLAAFAWAVYSIATRKLAVAGYGSLPATRRIFFYGLVFMLPVLLFEPLTISVQELLKIKYLGNLLFLGLGASAICFASWTYAIKKLGAIRSSVYIYLVPVITVISSSFLLAEKMTPLSIGGCLLTIGGLVLAERR